MTTHSGGRRLSAGDAAARNFTFPAEKHHSSGAASRGLTALTASAPHAFTIFSTMSSLDCARTAIATHA